MKKREKRSASSISKADLPLDNLKSEIRNPENLSTKTKVRFSKCFGYSSNGSLVHHDLQRCLYSTANYPLYYKSTGFARLNFQQRSSRSPLKRSKNLIYIKKNFINFLFAINTMKFTCFRVKIKQRLCLFQINI